MDSDSKHTWRLIGRGYYECAFPDWATFVNYVCTDMQQYQQYVWRGQRKEAWKLETTLERALKNWSGWQNTLIRDEKTREHLFEFQLAARGRRGKNPPVLADEDEWWALGQHHNLATPLLDWTSSPFVAAFFAFMKEGDSGDVNGRRAIFALHSAAADGAAKREAEERNEAIRQRQEDIRVGKVSPGILESVAPPAPNVKPGLRFIRPLTDENDRLVSQGGLFTKLNSHLPLEDWISEHQEKDDNSMTLIKFLIPNTVREQCLTSLNRMNINYLTLFPDLGGASDHCNLRLSNNAY